MYLDLCICDFMRFGSTIKSLKKLSYALCANRNGLKVIEMNENKTCKYYDLETEVKVRKYNVNIPELKKLLRSHKTLTNKEISEKLNLPITKVEHYFRNDDSFAIPDAEIWQPLKELLNIKDNSFDKAITEFEVKKGNYEKQNRLFDVNNLSPTICANDKEVKILMNENKTTKIIGEMDNSIDHTFESANRVYDKEGIAPTLPTCCGGGHQPKIIDNPKYRIRKLTPKECFRLMSFSDSDFKKAENVNSNSQLYKQAGNSIVENCLIAIFSQLNIQNTKSWNDRTLTEKHELIESRFQK